MAELRVRPAQLSDYRSVMDINTNVYDGFDYLPAMYRVYLHNPDAHCFVGLLADKVVCTRPILSSIVCRASIGLGDAT